jgi:[1-hydroxy-2-(trimethylamino)ethyl]phosphonate dioxygenase
METIASVDDVFRILQRGGSSAYFGEPVSVLEHCLQTAWLVQRNAWHSEALIAAALLHDIGHLLHNQGEDAAQRGVDTGHEQLAREALAAHFPDAVLEPIRLHVAAKRYLCFANPDYLAALSPASVESLRLQGGAMTATAAELFLAGAHAQSALALRAADDAAKIPGIEVPGLSTYRALITHLWR